MRVCPPKQPESPGFTQPQFLKKTGAGFTIPELLMSVFIIVFLTAIAVPIWRAGETTLALDRAAHKLSQDIRKATELALRAQWFTCADPEDAGDKISGYGVFFDQSVPDFYILFAECNGNNVYDVGRDGIVGGEPIALESGIEISSVSPASQTSIVFLPPTPQIFINDEQGGSTRITLSVAGNASRFKTITITNKGIIDID